MVEIRKIKKGENIKGYASDIVHGLFEGIYRDSGLPYTYEHFAAIAALVDELILPSSKYRNSAIATAWLHDTAEDIPGVDVFNPFEEEPVRQEGVIYLNDCLKEAGESGDYTSFMVNLMTHRKENPEMHIKGVSYQDYFLNIFTFPHTQPQRDLHIITGVVKMADRRKNTNPNESRNVNDLVEKYIALVDSGADSKTLEKIYKKTKTIDAFLRKGDMGLDIGLFVDTLNNVFRQKQRSVATDNLLQYLPLMEERLIVDLEENNGLFYWGKVRKLLMETYIDSLKIYSEYVPSSTIHEIKNMGRNRKAPEIPGYTRILKELRTLSAPGLSILD